jgi:hypothetical protein
MSSKLAHNVLAVNDWFLLCDKENAQHFTQNKNCGGEKYHKGAMRRLVFFVARAALAAKPLQAC